MAKKNSIERRDFVIGGLAATSALALIPAARAENPRTKAKPKTSAAQSPPLDVLVLSRLTFGARAGDFETFKKLGATDTARLHAFVERQLEPQKISDVACELRLEKENLPTLKKSLAQLWADHVVAADKLREEGKMMAEPAQEAAAKGENKKAVKKDENKLRLEPINELETAVWMRALYSERQLFERVVGFWHDHFSIYAWDQKTSPVFTHFDRDVIRKNAFGNFRDLLEGVAKSPAMLLYLDNAINQSGNPNENYARELFELHTLGAENYLGTKDRNSVARIKGVPTGYVDGDVYEAARCFTGWRIDQGNNSGNTGAFEYFEPWHDRFQKIVLGKPLREYQPPLKDGNDVLDLVAYHPGTARFISRKLCRRFICDDPPAALVEKVAAVFMQKKSAPDQMKHVLRAVILSPDFEKSWGQKVRRPFEYVAAFLRATGADFSPGDKFFKNFENTGHRPFSNRTPDGYPDVRQKWANANAMTESWRLMNQIFLEQIPGVSVDLRKLAKQEDNVHFINELSATLGRPIAQKTKDVALQFLDDNKGRPRRFLFTAGLIFMSPDFQWA